MDKKILSTVSAFVVLTNDGSVNWDSTLAGIRGQMEIEIEENRKGDLEIERGLDAIYDSLPVGTGLPTPMVVQTVSASMANGNIEAQIELVAKVEDFLKRTNRFVSKRGRSGGLFRIG